MFQKKKHPISEISSFLESEQTDSLEHAWWDCTVAGPNPPNSSMSEFKSKDNDNINYSYYLYDEQPK